MATIGRRVAFGIGRLVRKSVVVGALVVLVLVGLRAYQSTQGPPLRPWHTIVPDELERRRSSRTRTGRRMSRRKTAMFDQVHRRLQREMQPADRTPLNRYNDGEPDVTASLRPRLESLLRARTRGRDRAAWPCCCMDLPIRRTACAASPSCIGSTGFVAIAPRMPGHGTVPAGADARRPQGVGGDGRDGDGAKRVVAPAAVCRCISWAIRTAARWRCCTSCGASSMAKRSDVDRIVLLSPMIEVNSFARYAGLAGMAVDLRRATRSPRGSTCCPSTTRSSTTPSRCAPRASRTW